ncbi:MAG: hypothetical protein IPK16_01645 [Anaerolineales bacterium]|nr:hypothetical protein [Anaerolineales bacterium]
MAGAALDWNLRFGNEAGVYDVLMQIVRMQSMMFRYGAFDPDMKSLFDCGLFVENGALKMEYLDFAGFTCDPALVKRLLPSVPERIMTMKDFRAIARKLAGRASHRELLFRFKHELTALYGEMERRTDWAVETSFAPVRGSFACHTRLAATGSDRCEMITNQVIAKAKFRTLAPIGAPEYQCKVRTSPIEATRACSNHRSTCNPRVRADPIR